MSDATKVKRYTLKNSVGDMEPWPNSLPAKFVLASDYDQLRAELAKWDERERNLHLVSLTQIVDERDQLRAELTERDKRVERLQRDSYELTMMVRRLVRQVRKHGEDDNNTVATLAMILLTQLSGTGRPLRDMADDALAAGKGEGGET